MSKKIVVKLDLHDGRDKQRAIKAVSALIGIDEISVDMASQKLTVMGMVDAVNVVSKLRKASFPAATIVSLGPWPEVKKEEKKEEKKDEKKEGDAAKKDGEGEKKDGEGKKEGEGEKKDGNKKEGEGEKKAAPPPPTTEQIIAELMNQQYRPVYHPYYMTPHYYVQSMEENPNSCAIC